MRCRKRLGDRLALAMPKRRAGLGSAIRENRRRARIWTRLCYRVHSTRPHHDPSGNTGGLGNPPDHTLNVGKEVLLTHLTSISDRCLALAATFSPRRVPSYPLGQRPNLSLELLNPVPTVPRIP